MNNIYTNDPLGYYNILGVSAYASARDIKLNYRDRAKEWHPDYNKAPNAMEQFQKISIAYDILQNEALRLEYDLFALAYTSKNYPQMDILDIIKDRQKQENPFVRIISLQYVTGKFVKFSFREEKLACSQAQAKSEVLKCSLLNWLVGWWSIKSFGKNIKALLANYNLIGQNKQDNLTLLIHNAVAYNREGKKEKAYLSAFQALDYANDIQKEKIGEFLRSLEINKNYKLPKWNDTRLKIFQLIIPFLLLMSIAYPFAKSYNFSNSTQKDNEITYFQRVKYANGGEFVDDIVVSKIFDIPLDYDDDTKLYHVVEDVSVMYGPGKKFDVMNKLAKGHTVRITGHSVDKKWYRVMLDNADMGFLQSQEIRQGKGNEIPTFSQIIEQK